MNAFADIASWACMIAGGLFCVAGSIGMLRMPDFYTRLHAASVIETMGAGLLLTGMAIQGGLSLVTVKLVFIGLLIFFTSPAATHTLANAALARGLQPRTAPDDGGPWKP